MKHSIRRRGGGQQHTRLLHSVEEVLVDLNSFEKVSLSLSPARTQVVPQRKQVSRAVDYGAKVKESDYYDDDRRKNWLGVEWEAKVICIVVCARLFVHVSSREKYFCSNIRNSGSCERANAIFGNLWTSSTCKFKITFLLTLSWKFSPNTKKLEVVGLRHLCKHLNANTGLDLFKFICRDILPLLS